MKHFFKLTFVAAIATASIFTLSAFKAHKVNTNSLDAYQIALVEKEAKGAGSFSWTWSVTNPNPGNGDNGTLQNVSHFDIALSAVAETSLVSAEYSFDGITWISCPIDVVRDPSIRQCTSVDVLKFNAGTVGGQPTYYRATFDQEFGANPYSTSWIKSGVRTGCNPYFFEGVGAPTTN